MSRVVEAVATPVTPFAAAILSQDTIEIKGGSNMVVDSYDPTVTPFKYDLGKARGDVSQPGNKRNYGNVCTNAKKKKDTDEVIRLEKAWIYGIAAKGKGAVEIKNAPTAGVSGEIIDGFYRSMRQYDPSKIAGFRADAFPTVLVKNATDRPKSGYSKTIKIQCGKGATGSSGPETLYYKITKLHLHKDEILKIEKGSSPNDGVSWGSAEIWISDDVVIHNGGRIQIENGAKATIYFAKNLTLQEKDSSNPAIKNETDYKTYHAASTSSFADPSALQFYGATVSHKKKNAKLKSDMTAVFYAPDHEFEVNLKSGRNFYGSLTGRKFEIKGGTQIHYDETLADVGKPIDYTLSTWQEDWYDPAVRLKP